jgi:hypothetical protein
MTTFHLTTIPLAEPVTIYLASSRARIVAPGGGGPQAITAENGVETVLEKLECAFAINVVTQTIHAQIARIPWPLLIYSAEDFAAVAADLPEHHGERILQCLGSDPAAALQALADGTELPPHPPRVPREIGNWRAKAVLAAMGKLADVEAVIAALPEPQRTVVTLAWAGDAKLARRGATVTGLGAALGMSEAEIDALFIAADGIQI